MLADEQNIQSTRKLGRREKDRDKSWNSHDPIIEDRLLWRAQTFRHLVHLLPGQTILELGCGKGHFTHQLYKVSRGENPIIAATFQDVVPVTEKISTINFVSLYSIPGSLKGMCFDFIISMDLLDKWNCTWVLQEMYDLLKPGGKIVFYENNPWNVFIRTSRAMSKVFYEVEQRQLSSRPELCDLFLQIGFVKILADYNDFVFAPLTPRGVWWLRNLSIILENLSVIKTLARSILIHAQKPPQNLIDVDVSLCDHKQLNNCISVVVPCHNEEMNILPLVTQLLKLYGNYLYEIILIDDNSQDKTREVITNLAKQYQKIRPVFRTPPCGVGRAIKDGYKIAKGKYILSMDCDFQHILPEIRDLFDAAIEGHDVVIGSRFSRHSVLINYPPNKILANRAFHLLARLMFSVRFRDLTNNLKLTRLEVIQKLELTQPGFAVNAETGLLPLLMGYYIKEVPISWINRSAHMGVSSFKLFKVGGGYWKVLLRLWLQLVFNRKSYYPNLKLQKAKQIQIARQS